MNINKSHFYYKIMWGTNLLSFSVENLYKTSFTTPLTTFYFWPREDGWKLLNLQLNNKPWLTANAKFVILRDYQIIINYWLVHRNQPYLNIGRIEKHFILKNNIHLQILGIIS